MSSRCRTCIFRVGYAVAAFLVVLASTEGLARVLGLAPRLSYQFGNIVPDSHLPYRPRPLSTISGRSASDEYDFTYTHNGFGLRDVEHLLAKPPGVFRILGLGDSFTYGQGAAFEDTYLARLETFLNNRDGAHPRVEVIKAGIVRFFPEPERLLLQHYGVAFRPDLVTVAFLPNDLADTYTGIKAITVGADGFLKTEEANQLGRVATWLYLRSHACRIVLRRYVTWRIARKHGEPSIRPNDPELLSDTNWAKIEAEYFRMTDIAHEVNAAIAFIHIPQQGPWGAWSNAPTERLAHWCAEVGVPFIDVLPAMRRMPCPEELYWKRDGHPTPRGYRVIADTLCRALTELELVP
ncbi:MAG: SGNH/GDSL hydrolase family protein [Candidatus Eisenbacteria bacterium]|nr:SGNH/GDSL hydrolase family protein [Candidatus Eisenbacteria bacterium]